MMWVTGNLSSTIRASKQSNQEERHVIMWHPAFPRGSGWPWSCSLAHSHLNTGLFICLPVYVYQ